MTAPVLVFCGSLAVAVLSPLIMEAVLRANKTARPPQGDDLFHAYLARKRDRRGR